MKREIARLHLAPGDWKKIIVPVSGGKDSQVCLALAVDAAGPQNVLGVHQHTGFDHPLTYQHMEYMRDRYQVEIIDIKNPKYDSVPDVMLTEVLVPSRHARACTRLLKIVPWYQWLTKQEGVDDALIFLGMRATESTKRRENYGALADLDVYLMSDIGAGCPARLKNVRAQLPIVSWTTPRVFETLRKRGDAINPLYKQGQKRVGCYPCVFSGKATMRLTARDPVGREHMGLMSDAIELIQWARPETDVRHFFDHDLEALITNKQPDPFGFSEDQEDAGGCSWCSI